VNCSIISKLFCIEQNRRILGNIREVIVIGIILRKIIRTIWNYVGEIVLLLSLTSSSLLSVVGDNNSLLAARLDGTLSSRKVWRKRKYSSRSLLPSSCGQLGWNSDSKKAVALIDKTEWLCANKSFSITCQLFNLFVSQWDLWTSSLCNNVCIFQLYSHWLIRTKAIWMCSIYTQPEMCYRLVPDPAIVLLSLIIRNYCWIWKALTFVGVPVVVVVAVVVVVVGSPSTRVYSSSSISPWFGCSE